MTRPRVDIPTHETRTTASSQEGSGCSSGLFIPPLAVLLVSGLLTLFAYSPFVSASPLPSSSLPDSGYAQSTQGLASFFRPEVQFWGTRILAWSAEFGLDPNLAATVMQIESCGHPQARSSAGAMGLFQVMPFHFYVNDNPYDPDTNARRGLAYLAKSLELSSNNTSLALAGYNGGIGVINRGEWAWPAETKRYVYFGGQIYADALAGLTSSERLDEWFLKFGAGLCEQARLNQ